MATQRVLRQTGTQLLFADHATDFGAGPVTASGNFIIGTPTDVPMNFSVIAATATSPCASSISPSLTSKERLS